MFLLLTMMATAVVAAPERPLFEAGVGLWDYNVDGFLESGSGSRLTFDENDEPALQLEAILNLPVFTEYAFRLRTRYNSVNGRGTGFANTSGNIFGVDFVAADSFVDLSVETDQFDSFALFSFGDELIGDLGLGLKYIDGYAEAVVTTSSPLTPPITESGDRTFELFIPLVYGAIGYQSKHDWDLLLEASGLLYEDNEVLDIQAGIGYQPFGWLSMNLGYRYLSLQLEDGSFYTEFDIDGLFLTVSVPFGSL